MAKIKYFAIFRRAFPYVAKYKKLLIFDLIFSLAATFCEVLFPKLLKTIIKVVGDAVEKNSKIAFDTIFFNGSIFIVLALLEVIGIYYMNYIGHVMGAKIETDMRRDLFSHLQKLNISYFSANKIGQMLSRFTHDLSKISEFMHHLPEQMLIISIRLVVPTILIMTTDIYLGGVIIIFSPLMFFVCNHYNMKIGRSYKLNAVQLGELNSQVESSLLGIHVTKSFSNERYEEARFESENVKTYKTKKELYKNLGEFNSIIRFFVLSTYFAITVVGVYKLIVGNIAKEDFFVCFIYADMILKQIIAMIHTMEKYQDGQAPLTRFFEVMDIDPSIKDSGDFNEDVDEVKNVKNNVKGDICFNNVFFKYDEKSEYVFKGLNVNIKAGEHVALIGVSGSGKTTFCSLLQRFYDTSSGDITIDGVNIKNMPLRSLHKLVGVVEQDVYLFSGTIFENIHYGNVNASEEDVIRVAKKVGLLEFINRLPDKFESHVGDRGVKLSGGQKQRISIARMFLKNPAIIILDEATSSLDIITENKIRKSFEELSKDKTTIVIAHRLSTIKNADKILVLESGKIEAFGTHDELIKSNEFYKNLYFE